MHHSTCVGRYIKTIVEDIFRDDGSLDNDDGDGFIDVSFSGERVVGDMMIEPRSSLNRRAQHVNISKHEQRAQHFAQQKNHFEIISFFRNIRTVVKHSNRKVSGPGI